MAIAEARQAASFHRRGDHAVDGWDADVEHRHFNFTAPPRASTLDQFGHNPGDQMHSRAGIDERSSCTDAGAIAIAGHVDDSSGRLYREIHCPEPSPAAIGAVAFTSSIDQT